MPLTCLHGARHADAFRVQTRRRLTAIYYVNPCWIPAHGGVLRLYTPDGSRDVEPLLDRLVLFVSEQVEHEVLPSFALRVPAPYALGGAGTRRSLG